jgi:hypothetical protein
MPIKFSLLAVLLLLFTTSPALAKKKKPTTTNTAPSAASNNSSVLSKFKSCKEANRAGVSNVSVTPGYTPPGWNHSADRDNDGIACEKK